jgi:RimJ/RimL family protein N-acetyltransferase
MIRVLKPGDEAALEAFLLPLVETSMFLIGNSRISGLVDKGEPYEGTYAAAFEDGRITGIVAHYWNRALIFQAPAHLHELWRAAARASKRPIGGLIGPDDQVSAAKEALGVGDERVQMDETERLYSLDLDRLSVPSALVSGAVSGRRTEARDLDVITSWNVAYGVEAIGDVESHELWQRCRAAAERELKDRRTWILERDGQPVASSSFNTAIDEAVQVGGVWTPPELRCRGYGRAVVAASLLDARAEGVERAILFTGKGNIPAQRAYEALGFRQIGAYRLVLLHTPIEMD